MNSFLNLTTVFDTFSDRTIEKLSSIYSNKCKLQECIGNTIGADLAPDQIKGKSVLLKPNWVKQSKIPSDEVCLRTNDNFILATLRVILAMEPSKVVIGDAPIQGCKWDLMISEAFSNEIHKLNDEFNIPILIMDFRRRTYTFSCNNPESGIRPLSDFIIFDLGNQSHLEPITVPNQTNFRVTNYDPDRMSSAHSSGVHKYCITKELFDADIVISLPKIKTHQKTGITGALKNLVGVNGDKDFLPHHRIGGTKRGGDCYPGGSSLRYWSEHFLDMANRRQGKNSFWFWQKLSSFIWKLSFPGPKHSLVAGWHGNDTTWRMVLDLNKISRYGKPDGTLSDDPQRLIFSICDGIIGGQGNGPLEPEPLPLGFISFTNNSVINDRAMAILMGLSVDKIPLLKYNSSNMESECQIRINGKKVKLEGLIKFSTMAIPPIGWIGYLNELK